ncbi:Flp/Fap pilin component [Paraurantiacibacter namhicola]|uniref:Flp/Fap pilin component n=1 Tax=Paraurantiacibacter namhicola TaxID=645517 RepID=A0A1C7D8A5_9SPHN|nr:Flp/Fap pilin component [Paraurantiacibacter namhicola]
MRDDRKSGIAHLRASFERLLACEQGATAIEYGLIASLIAIGSVQALSLLGGSVTQTFTTVSGNMAAPVVPQNPAPSGGPNTGSPNEPAPGAIPPG